MRYDDEIRHVLDIPSYSYLCKRMLENYIMQRLGIIENFNLYNNPIKTIYRTITSPKF